MPKPRTLLLFPIILFNFLLILPLSAHEGRHEHVLSKDDIIAKAQDIISTAIEIKKIDLSWKNANLEEAKTITIKSSDEWFLKYTNENVALPQKHLYLFFTLDGKFLAMNYTGK